MSDFSKKIFRLKSIRTKLFLTVLITIFSVGIVAGLTISNISKTSLKKEITDKLLLLADAKEGQVYAYLDFLKSRTLDFSSDRFIKDSLAEIEKNNSAETVQSLNLYLQKKKSLDQSIAGIMILDPEGKIAAATDEKEIGKSESGDEYFIKGKTGVYFAEEKKGYSHFGIDKVFIVSAPLKDRDSGKFLGLLVNVFKTDKLSDILSGKYQLDAGAATSELIRSKTTEVYLVNKDKKMFVNSRLTPKGNLNSDTEIKVNTLPVKKCLENNKEISSIYQNYAKKEVIGVSMCFPQYGWALLVEITTAEAFVSVNELGLAVVILAAIAIVIVIIVLSFLANNIIKPIKVLSRGAEIISGGDLNYRVKITSGDEIEQLGNIFNNMISKLKESYSGLEEKVKKQTDQLSKQLSEIEKKNAFLEQTKIAMLNIIEDSREIENSLQKFRLAAENAYEHIIITDESGKIIYANSAVERTTGYTKNEVLGKTPALWSGNMPKVYYKKMWDTIKTKKIAFEGEIKNKRKNGEEYIAQISISPILDEKKNIKFYVGLERDVTVERNLTEELRKEKEEVIKKATEITTIEKEKLLTVEKLYQQLKDKVQEIEEKNKTLEDTKKTITNLLEGEKKLEVSLREERDKSVAIFASMGEGLLVVDKDYKVVNLNPVAGELLGLPTSQLISQDLRKVVIFYKNGAALPPEMCPFGVTLKTGKPVVGGIDDNYSFTTAKVTYPVPISFATTPLRGDGITGVVVVFRGITREKQSKEMIEKAVVERTRELQEEKVRLFASVNSLSLGFIMTDKENNIFMINQSARNILCASSSSPLATVKECTLSHIEDELKGEIDLRALISKCVTEKKPILVKELIFQNRYIKFFLTPIIDNLLVLGTVVLVEDITEAKILDRSKDEFFSIASHELRTPLTAIRGNVSLIEQVYGDKIKDKEFKEMIDDIHESSVRLIEIVNDFLNISQLEQRKIEFKKEKIDLYALISAIIVELKVSAKAKSLSLKLVDSQKLPQVLGDREKVKEVLVNLIGNAIKYTEKGDVIVVAKAVKGGVEIDVADTGRGIPLENQNLLFRKFTQASSSLYTRDTTKGTGLGLYISKLLVEGMGGRIALVKSEVEKGSTFSFILPYAKV